MSNWRWITGDFHQYILFVAQILTWASCYVSVENHIMPWISGIFANSNWKCNMIYWWESQAGHHATHMHQIPFPPLTWESNMRMATEVLHSGMCQCLWDAVVNSLFGRTSTYEQPQEILTVKVHGYLYIVKASTKSSPLTQLLSNSRDWVRPSSAFFVRVSRSLFQSARNICLSLQSDEDWASVETHEKLTGWERDHSHCENEKCL